VAKNLCILGSTGSIGQTTLRVVGAHRDRFNILVLAARSSGDVLLEQAREFRPRVCVLTDQAAAVKYCQEFNKLGIELLAEEEALQFIVSLREIDAVVCAMSGAAGLLPLEAALVSRKEVLFANKEALVVGGGYIMQLADASGARFIPIDSEHSALYQCLLAGKREDLAGVTITASGGPFLNTPPAEAATAGLEQVLAHPIWQMGPEVTVNSATMMNKALEVIEAHFLFGLPPEKISVLVHPQGIVHGMAHFADGSTIAQMALPDMAVPVQYALCSPERPKGIVEMPNLAAIGKLEFMPLEKARFPLLKLGYEALSGAWWEPIALNAVNETAIRRFLKGEMNYGALVALIQTAFAKRHVVAKAAGLPDAPRRMADILEADTIFRRFAAVKL
jgi:1-deoxy-D-xylulose-5-phosphate reductoisomerase